METIYVTKTVKFEKSADELDFDNREIFGWEDHDKHEFTEICNELAATDAEPIEIDRLIAILTEAKQNGSTHVAVEYHTDHIGYDITGFEMRVSTEEEIEKYRADRDAEKERRRKIHELQSQIQKLRNQ